MSTGQPSTRRLALAISAAAASTTIAIGVTAGSLLGWFRPATSPAAQVLPDPGPPTPPGPSDAPSQPGPGNAPTQPVIFVPIAPDLPPEPAPEPTVQLARYEHEDDAHDREERAEGQRHDDDADDDDDGEEHGDDD